ncbi:Anti-sigma-K factor rskA [Marivirga sericea]|uniref:Anti-sigma-K factor rskA n=1 Tax=Marivirga sericea TaxID=1028 RepID=A0A1X7K094_9BACT|nr:anti-sigma factor [Marivirga sericea]SMG34028.1 Anti-sigma-K factor rskA [Marivirga sericea]
MSKIEAYISSGVIEAFVMGQLNEAETKQLLQYADEHEEVRKALDEAEETLFALGQKGSITPPALSKNTLFEELGIDIESDKVDSNQLIEKEIKKETKSFSIYPYLSAAASVIATIGIVLSAYYYNQWQETEAKLSNIMAQNQTMAQQYNVVKNQMDQYAQNVEILRQPGIETVPMKGLDIAPEAQAFVHWNKKTNEVFLNAKKMPSNQIDNQYQLWAIVDGKPVDMGVFDVAGDMTSLLKMKATDEASAFAVTLEPRGGSENPTMEKMYVIGQI